MSLKLTAPDKKLTFTKEELQHFAVFLDTAKIKCFTEVYNFKNHNKDREVLYELILAGFAEKVINKIISNYHQPAKKKIKIPVNPAEEKTLTDVLFHRLLRMDNPFTIALVEGLKAQLKPIKAA